MPDDPDLGFSLLLLLFLLILSAFFSGSETAMTAASRARMKSLEKEGSRRAAMVNRLRQKKDQFIGTVLLGNNLVNIGASALATSVAISLFDSHAVAYVTIGLTFLILIFSEVLPKIYAINHPERLALFVAPLFLGLVRLAYPVVWVVNSFVNLMLRLFGANKQHGLVSAYESLRGAIEVHHEDGEMVKQDRDMLGSILDLGDLTVSDVMIHRRQMFTQNLSDPAEKILAEVMASPYTRIPFWRDDPENIVGVLHAKDLLRAIMAQKGKAEGLDVSTLLMKPWFIPESTGLKDQLHAFRAKRQHVALVVDEYGALEGMVTLEDILEEIVGEIDDEHDLINPGIRRQTDGSVLVDGGVTIRDLNRAMDWNLPDDDAATIGGLVVMESREIPPIRAEYHFHGMRFTVLGKEGNHLTELLIRPDGKS